jgi:hypothetical protein
MNTTRMMKFHIPEDQPEFLKAAARVSLSHGHLDYSLRMCIKTFAVVSIVEALGATKYTGARALRTRIRKFAKKRLGDGPTLVRLQGILARCEAATEQRNRLIHEIVAIDEDGVPLLGYLSWDKLPSPADLNALAARLTDLANELNHARLQGWLAVALEKRRNAN